LGKGETPVDKRSGYMAILFLPPFFPFLLFWLAWSVKVDLAAEGEEEKRDFFN